MPTTKEALLKAGLKGISEALRGWHSHGQAAAVGAGAVGDMKHDYSGDYVGKEVVEDPCPHTAWRQGGWHDYGRGGQELDWDGWHE